MDIEDALRTLGGVAHHSELLPLGITLDGAARAVRSGRIERIRRGWFRVADAPTDVVSAVRVGGALTCVSVLKTLGVWCVDDEILHVRLGRGISHAGSPTDRTVPLGDPTLHGVHVHRSLASTLRPAGRVAVDTVDDALMQIVVCQPRDHAIAAFDSALNLKLTTRQRLLSATGTLRQRHRDVMGLVDPSAQSGLETKARLRFRALGIPYRTQVSIPRVGRVDLVVGDRLVIELDGRKWHSTTKAFAEDRRRDLELHEQGYLPVRLTYAQTMFEWKRVETLVRRYVAQREHRWGAGHRRHLALLP